MIKMLVHFLLIVPILFSYSVLAKGNPPQIKDVVEQCNVNAAKDFGVLFTLNTADRDEKILATKKGQGNNSDELLPLWTSDDDINSWNPPDYIVREEVIFDTLTQVGQVYHVLLVFERSGSAQQGDLKYYLDPQQGPNPSGFWTLIQTEFVDLSGFSAQITIASDEIEYLDCLDDDEIPPINPEVPPEIPDQCEVLPHAVQSWGSASSITFSDAKVVGTIDKSGRIGFGQVNKGWGTQTACDNKECVADASLIIEEPSTLSFSPLGPDLVLNSDTDIPEGKYNSISLAGNNDYSFIGTNYEVGSLTVTGGSTLHIKAGTLLRVNSMNVGGGSTVVVEGNNSENFIVWGEPWNGISPSIYLSTDAAHPIYANIFSRGSVTLSGSALLYGSITSGYITLSGSSRVERVIDNCGGTTPGNYTLELSPLTGINLTCEDQSLTFQVKKDGSNATDYPGTIEVTNNGGLLQPSGGSYTPNGSGTLGLTLSQQEVSTVSVTGCLSTDCSGTSITGSYEFVPQKFALESPKGVVAAKPISIDIWPRQCNEQGDPAPIPSDEYSGTKTLILSSTTYVQPNADRNVSEVISIKDKDGNWVDAPNNQLRLTFSAGSDSEAVKATTEIMYPEAGSVSYELKDEVCITNDDGQEECEEIIGEQLIQSRPWTFALCEPTGNEISGTSESGDFFKRSGELFGLDAVPIRWVSDGETDPSTPIEVSAFCNQIDSLETKNFYPDLAPAVNVSLEAELHSPHVDLGSSDTGTIGSGLEGVPVDGIPNNANTSGPVQFSSLKWREAGSIKVTASLKDQADYLFESINPGYRSVGRFSPNHLAMLDEDSDPEELWTQWDYADGYDEFAYMKQEFPHMFKVQAQANDNTPTLNYGLFNNSFVSNLDYVANTKDQTVDVSLLGRLSVLTFSWSGEDWPKSLLSDPSTLVVTIDDFAFAKKAGDSIGGNEVTEPDGPFDSDNSVFGIEVFTIVDGVDFDTLDIPELNEDTNTGKSFPNQPEFRYGRMNLDDVGGNTAQTLRVPLRVEYWDGSSFVTNQEDSGSLFDATQSYCVQTIWNNLPNGADTSAGLVSDGERQVSDGASDELSATHNLAAGSSNERAQVRLWLRQGSDSPQRTETGVDCTSNGSSFTNQPWLHYNWRNKGDEDPSAVVTFGTFRGNDRIIFKGERGLIGN
ncbi:hypothetical protein BCV02_15600 [Vibrio breoganii]|uniref:DUF6701 domain-containing protein n=1 Tax=Vibrio breoganii TaxID=553239 RepID=UPI000C8252C9|nr:DUF6701 domain-containing protein [Vibrio breoganii]PMG00043.1 hypothetical protein BCV02_15600 [Vibrio breoganii]